VPGEGAEYRNVGVVTSQQKQPFHVQTSQTEGGNTALYSVQFRGVEIAFMT